MPLTDRIIQTAKPKDKSYKLTDADGMYLLISPTGGKSWKLKYRYGGKEKKLTLGSYPEISLADARNRRFEARKLLANDIDPGEIKKAQQISKAGLDSFEVIAREWHQKHLHKWTYEHGKQILIRLEQNIFPWLGKAPITEIKPPELLSTLRRMENRGALETAHRVCSTCGQIFRYAIATGRAERDVTQDIKGAIPPTKKKHLASITEPKKVGQLLRAIEVYEGSHIVKSALKLAPLLFVRPGELRSAEWIEINWEVREWRIPAEKMKARREHIVPLAEQAIGILKELQPFTDRGDICKFLFPSPRSPKRPMSNNAILSALTAYGF